MADVFSYDITYPAKALFSMPGRKKSRFLRENRYENPGKGGRGLDKGPFLC